MKKIIAVLLMAALLLGAIPAYADGAFVRVEVTPSVTEAEVGDTVEFVITAQAEGLVAMQFEVRMPEGLSYVPGSGAAPKGLAQKLGVPAADWTESSMMFTFYNDVGIKMAKGTELVRFSCVAEKAGSWDVIIFELLPFDGNFEEFTPELTVHTLKVNGDQETATAPDGLPTVEATTAPSEGSSTSPVQPVPDATDAIPEVSAPVTGTTAPAPGVPEVTVPGPDTPVSNVPDAGVTAPGTADPVATAPDEVPEVSAESEAVEEGQTGSLQPPVAEDLPLDVGIVEDSSLTKPESQEEVQPSGDTLTVGALTEPEPEKKIWPWILAGVLAAGGAAGAVVFLRKKRPSEEEK